MRRGRIRWLSFGIAAAAVLGGLTWKFAKEAQESRRSLEYCYRRALWEVSDSVEEMETGIRKAMCASSPRLFSACCTQVYAQSLAAQAALGQLPGDGENLEDTAAFLSKAGDYLMALSAESAEGTQAGVETYETLSALHQVALTVEEELQGLCADVDDGAVSVVQRMETNTENTDIAGSLTTLEEDFPSLPTLIYDGPFSDDFSGDGAGVLAGEPEVTQEEAAESAARLLPESELSCDGCRAGTPEIYVFSGSQDGDECTVEVTKRGGHVIRLRRQHAALEENLTPDKAAQAAEQFLTENGFSPVQESYRDTADGEITICFVPTQEEVLLYPDLVKVTVSLDDGTITGLDAEKYWLHHALRQLPEVQVSRKEALGLLSPWLTPETQKYAVIPTETGKEVYCHEIFCTDGEGGHCLVYLNTQTGREEEVLILLESESGTLTK